MSPNPQSSALLELDGLAKQLLPSTGRLTAAIEFARAVAARAGFLLPLVGGVEGLTEKCQALYDQYCAPYDIPGLKDDTEKAIDAASKLVIRDLIHGAAEAVG